MRSSTVSWPPLLSSLLPSRGAFFFCTIIVNTLSFNRLPSVGASLGHAGEDGEAAPRRPCQQDGQVSLPGRRPPGAKPAMVQERKGVQEGPKDRRLQGGQPAWEREWRSFTTSALQLQLLSFPDQRPHVDPDHGVGGAVRQRELHLRGGERTREPATHLRPGRRG